MTFPTSLLTQFETKHGNISVFLKHKTGVNALKGAIHALAYSAGAGQYLLSGGHRTISLYNPFPSTAPAATPFSATPAPVGPKLIQTYSAHGYEVLAIAVHSSNAHFVSVGGDKLVFLWDVAEAKTIRRWAGHSGRVNDCCWAGEGGSVVVTGSYDATVRLWDTKSSSTKPIQVFEEARDSVMSVAVREHEVFAGGVDGRVRVYDLRMGLVYVDVVGQPVTSLTLTTDGTAFLLSTLPPEPASASTAPAQILLLDKATGRLLQSYTGHANSAYRIRSTLAMHDRCVVSGSENGTVMVWDTLEGTVLAKVEGVHGDKAVSCVVWNERRGEWASGGSDGVTRVWGT